MSTTTSIETLTEKYPYFLQGGGEMGELTRSYDWKSSSLGTPDQWPQNLRITVSMLLSSRFPMFLWWGPDMIQFYNDAYRPSLGNDGKHPKALGQKAIDCWQEIWDVIYPLIKHVKDTGEATWSEDQLIPIYRNGEMQDVYWTFGYSAIKDEEGNVEGVLVVCNETTEKVLALQHAKASERRFLTLISESTIPTAVVTGPDMILDLANDAMLKNWDKDKSIIGKPLLDILPEIKTQRFPQLLQQVYASGQMYGAHDELVYLKRNGVLEAAYHDFSYKPLFNDDGGVHGILLMAHDVTDRVLTRKRLAQSEENLRNTILKAPVAMAILEGKKQVVQIANERMLELWGTDSNIIGKPFFEALPTVSGQGFEELLDDVYTTGKTYAGSSTPVVLPRAEGPEMRYCNFVYEAYRNPDGIITAVIVVAYDVTEQVMAGKTIELSEQRVRSLVESAPFPIGLYEGREMKVIMANQSLMDVWGKGNDVIGKTYMELLPEVSNEIKTELVKVYDTGVPFHARNQHVPLVMSGVLQTFYFNYSFTPVFDVDGNIFGVMNTAADVTDLHLVKQQVEQSEQNLRNMIMQAPVAMCILAGAEHVIEVANQMMIDLWGKEREAVMGKPVFEALPDARNQGLEAVMESVYRKGETFSAVEMPVELVRNGKEDTVYQNFVYEPYRDSDGNIIGVLAVTIDVTPQVMARQRIEEIVAARTQELELSNDSLQKSNDELEQFAYIASHDLQEPLRKVRTFSQMLEQSLGQIDERSQSYLDKINNAAARMTVLIRDVLAYSQLSKTAINYTQVDLNEIIDNIRNDLELVIEQNHAVIEVAKLPVVDAIPLQMTQLFGNLISNALKFGKPGETPTINITTRLLTDAEMQQYTLPANRQPYHIIEVKDNGIGFDQNHAAHIFNIFQRLHGNNEYTGTGIGLAICKKITQNHHGHIYAVSSRGSGATFGVVLPATQTPL